MSDLLEMAKPARDALLVDLDRAMPDDASQAQRDGLRLSVHLVALLSAFLTDRHRPTSQPVRDPGLQDVVTLAFGVAIANIAVSIVPVRNGRAVSGSDNVLEMLDSIAQHACHQVSGTEAGLADVAVAFDLDAGGRLVARDVDLSRFGRGRGR